ncbi:MAG: thioredoxin family protein [Longispora sp.]|nr:thioredoxin family protein [Longispora sp. (in: high G+C Gram-positive bacteria)]
MAVTSLMVPIGTPAPDFDLPSLTGERVSLRDFDKAPALLVAFLCEHCPYVRHIENPFSTLLREFPALATVGICSNDPEAYPADGPEGLAAQAKRAGWEFPYLIDTSQDVAKAYRAACTPDFFLYSADRRLAYRGALDESTPGNGKPLTGELLRDAIERVLGGQPVPEPHKPSTGCSIKFRPGNEPTFERMRPLPLTTL